ncbi:hypothetical protein Tco_0650836, partial [Tanacetum coccineum]
MEDIFLKTLFVDILHVVGVNLSALIIVCKQSDDDALHDDGTFQQWCRDFKEQGFFLRGDMCPMEHGLNRIVVEDVLLDCGCIIRTFTSIYDRGKHVLNSEGRLGKNINYGLGDNGLDVSGTSIDSASAFDFYDPDQPLLFNDSLTSTGLRSITQPNIKKTDSLLDPSSSDDSDNEGLSNSVSGVGFSNTRSSGSSTIIRKRTEMGENMILRETPSSFMHNDTMDSPFPSISTRDPPITRSVIVRFNFYVFPMDELKIRMPCYSFSYQSSYLASMAREDFDFNVCIYD